MYVKEGTYVIFKGFAGTGANHVSVKCEWGFGIWLA